MALLEYEGSIHEMTSIMSNLDCLISFASCGKSFSFTRTLKATQARHPLQELLVEHYIPNDIFLNSSDFMKIVTGHNGSGEPSKFRILAFV